MVDKVSALLAVGSRMQQITEWLGRLDLGQYAKLFADNDIDVSVLPHLQGIAAPNTVVIANSTRKLLGKLFEFEDLGGKDLKGIEGPERSWAVLRPNPVDSRFDALHAAGVTALKARRTGPAAPALVQGNCRRGTSRFAHGRTGDRHVEIDCCASGAPRY
jgi:hypothetical protein